MSTNKGDCRCRTTAVFYPIWYTNPSLRHHVVRFLWTLFALGVTVYCSCLMSVLADSFFIPGTLPPLPDRIHDQILGRRPMPSWLLSVVDACTFWVVFGTFARSFLLLPFPLNLQVVSRFCTMAIVGFSMRSIAIVVTTVPPSKPNCVPHRPQGAWQLLTVAFKQAADHNLECAGMIISGHSLNMMHGFMCWMLYGRCQCASERKDKRRPFCCRDVTWRGEPRDTLEGCFLYQCFAFLRLWVKLRRSGCRHAAATAAARCFSSCPEDNQKELQNETNRRNKCSRVRQIWSVVTRLPVLRYFTYAAAITGWIVIPLCYNHYAIDVFFALMLGFLWWTVYHLIVTVLVVQKRGATAKLNTREPLSILTNNSLTPHSMDWRCGDAAADKSSSNAAAADNGDTTDGNTEKQIMDVELSIQQETTPGSGTSERGGTGKAEEVMNPLDATEANTLANASCLNCNNDRFSAEFRDLHLDWILQFPIFQPITWVIRNIEGL
uniref:Sphingolipid synthase n=1 Tax=Eimeria falciformis TaxID=84963 RepID=A0A3G1QX94_9EIME|nr:sphingolipid synthase [Eimeria falciformis]